MQGFASRWSREFFALTLLFVAWLYLATGKTLILADAVAVATLLVPLRTEREKAVRVIAVASAVFILCLLALAGL